MQNFLEIQNRLLSIYKEFFVLRIKVVSTQPNYEEIKQQYIQNATNHNNKLLNNQYLDAGFNLLLREDYSFYNNTSRSYKIDFGVVCSGTMICDNTKEYSSGYYMYPRSSTGSNTSLRLANSVGIIDAGYRGHLMACFDVIQSYNNVPRTFNKGTSLVQICAPSLVPMVVLIEDDLNENTERGVDGFGSTGK